MNENFWSAANKHPILMIVGIGVGLSGVAKIINAARGETYVNSLFKGFGSGAGCMIGKYMATICNPPVVNYDDDEEDGA